jgi:nucleoside 2-deoxyribosyltransferase
MSDVPVLIYLAAPLFNPEERALNERLTRILERRYSVFLPQRDGVLIPGAKMDSLRFDELSACAYEADIAAIRRSNVVLAVLNGRSIDEGVAFELGFASAIGKQCFAYKSDARTLLPYGDNPMIRGAVDRYFRSSAEIKRAVSGRFFG